MRSLISTTSPTVTSSSSTANSSPPSLATVSLSRVHSTHPPGHLDQDRVAGRMAEPVVDRLELVEVDEEQGHPDVAASGQLQGVRDPVEEDAAVGQVGQWVVARVVDHVGGQLQPGECVGAEHGQGVESVLVGLDRRSGPVPRRRDHPERVLAATYLRTDLERLRWGGDGRRRPAAGSVCARRASRASITRPDSCTDETRTAASSSTVSRRGVLPAPGDRPGGDEAACPGVRRAARSIHHGLPRRTTAPR